MEHSPKSASDLNVGTFGREPAGRNMPSNILDIISGLSFLGVVGTLGTLRMLRMTLFPAMDCIMWLEKLLIPKGSKSTL